MNKKYKIIIFSLLGLIVLTLFAGYLKQSNIAVLEPAGTVGEKERTLIWLALGLALIVVIPVYVMLFAFAWRYREGAKKKAVYSPELSGSRMAETVWWLIPAALITILSAVTWRSSHELDPYRSIASGTRPLKIQVVAMDWKWLFIYPDQDVASVNFVKFPKDTPLDFQITSDAPMNSFWIPQLGGQIYAMPGMMTQLHLIANRTGSFRGSSANISGKGFSRMTFTAESSSRADYDAWTKSLKGSSEALDVPAYGRLARPGVSPVRHYSSVKDGLFEAQIVKYLVPSSSDGRKYHFMPSVSLSHGGKY